MKYPKEYLNEIKLRLKVSSVVSKQVNLKKRGKEFIGLSPFKNEKTPSFTVNDEKGFYHCFSSGEHGNIFDFLMKTRSLGFGEVVKILALEAGMPVYKFSKGDAKKEERLKKYTELLKSHLNRYHDLIFDNENKFALTYLFKRGLSEELIKKFKIGYVPKNDVLFEQLSKNFSKEDLFSTGIYYELDNKSKIINRFNSRIIFPIFNLSGEPIAFGGRAIQKNKLAKYINSPETEFYKKGNVLFNLDKIKNLRSKTKSVIIVEGYMDVLGLFSKGIFNVISNSGTSLTENQIKLTWKFFEEPTICFDGDDSGKKAALRAAENHFQYITETNKLFFLELPKGNDPDDYIKRYGKEKFLDLLKQRKSIEDYIWDQHVINYDLNSPFEVSKFEKKIKSMCFSINDEVLKKYIFSHFLFKLKKITKSEKNVTNKNDFKILKETSKVKRKKNLFTKEEIKEFDLLYIMLNYSSLLKDKISRLNKISFSSQSNHLLKNKILQTYELSDNKESIKNKINKNLSDEIKLVEENTNLNIILSEKTLSQIDEIFNEVIKEYKKVQSMKKIESYEKDLINNFDEKSYNEFLKLKNQIISE